MARRDREEPFGPVEARLAIPGLQRTKGIAGVDAVLFPILPVVGSALQVGNREHDDFDRRQTLPERLGGCGAYGSPGEDISLNATLGFVPRLDLLGSGFQRGGAALDFRGPRLFRVRIGWAIQASQQFGSEIGASLDIEPQRIGEKGFGRLGHVMILR
jgi:hypothetical protein